MSKTIKKTAIVELAGEKVELKAIAVPKIISLLTRNRQLGTSIKEAIGGDFTAFAIFEDMTEELMNDLIDASAGWNSGKAHSLDIEPVDQALAALTALEITIPDEEKKILAFKTVVISLYSKMTIAAPTLKKTAGVSS